MRDLLKNLRESGLIQPGSDIESGPVKRIKPKFEDIYVGTWDFCPSGDVFIISDTYPYGYNHGRIALDRFNGSSEIFYFEKFHEKAKENKFSKQIIFFDIETSSLSFGAGSFIFQIGLCFSTENGIETELLIIDHPASEKALLEKFNSTIEKFPIVCSYNGKSFDAPFITNRNYFHQLDNPLGKKHHIDLLTYARRLWKIEMNSCKLSEVERVILGLQRDASEIPGWLVPQTYLDFLQERDPKILEGVIYHNKIDVLSLAALFQHITYILKFSDSKLNLNATEYFALAKLYEKTGDIEQSQIYYQIALDQPVPANLRKKILWNYSIVLKRIGNLSTAVKLWEQCAEAGEIDACIELSMFYEHTQKNYIHALKWAKKARNLAKDEKTPKFQTNLMAATEHRINRIIEKRSKDEKREF